MIQLKEDYVTMTCIISETIKSILPNNYLKVIDSYPQTPKCSDTSANRRPDNPLIRYE